MVQCDNEMKTVISLNTSKLNGLMAMYKTY